MNEFKECCKTEIERIWKACGGSMNVVHYEGKCPVCGHYIGLTQTTEAQRTATKNELKKFGLDLDKGIFTIS